METVIGRGLIGVRATTAAIIGLLAVAVDFWLVWLRRYPESIDGRWAVALIASAAHLWLSGGDLPTLGLKAPAGDWRSWCRSVVVIGLAASLSMGALAITWVAAGWRLPIVSLAPGDAGPPFFRMCVFAPLLEETIYRIALCVPLATVVGPRWAIVASGVVFGLLHVAYGNPSPENLLGGFFLAWAYLRCGSVCGPILLHSTGNLIVLAGQIGVWYLSGVRP
ncbi:CPBP family intramembrane glutamic endopeptidase [Singulisphaera sp. Ch08]|uniref:CPBP family intramembrane glutamic endopeptidase n=1 Tax=Singulisphaera sp. Ch08 TaxID=3120278 RepID=A0AAU7CA78_9BACT